MGVLLNWAAATVLGGMVGTAGSWLCPSDNDNGPSSWAPVELAYQLRHDLRLDKRMPIAWRAAGRGLDWLSHREYATAFGTGAWDCDVERPPRAEPVLMLARTQEMREANVVQCAERERDLERDREREAWWKAFRADLVARRLAHRDPG